MTPELVDVRVLEIPVALHARTAAHLAGLQREFELIQLGGAEGIPVAERLQALIAELTEEYGGVAEQPRAELRAAIERGIPSIDLTYPVPASLGPATERLRDLLDEVDAHCRSRGHLLTLVTPDEEVEYRHWFLGEFIRQVAGEDPVPWSQREPWGSETSTAPSPDPGAPSAGARHGWTVVPSEDGVTLTVSGPLDLVSAPALRDLLVTTMATTPVTTIDLAACDFIDSVGVSVLLAAVLRADAEGTVLRFRMGEAARRVLRLGGVLDRITVVDG